MLVVSERYWPEGGGAEQATHLITTILARAGLEVTVLTGTPNPEFCKGVEFAHEPSLAVNSKVQLWLNLLTIRRAWENQVQRADVVYIPRLAYPVVPHARAQGKRVVVHLHDYQPLTFEADHFESMGAETHLTTEVRQTLISEVMEKRGASSVIAASFLAPINRLARRWISSADAVVCVSGRHAEIVKESLPELRSKILTVGNPLPEVPYTPGRTYDNTFVYLGGESWHKGFYTLLEGARIASARHELRLLMAGQYNEETRAMLEKPASLHRGEYVMVGRLPKSGVLNALSTSRGLVCPSINEETLSYAVMEGMLAGLAPIASRAGGMPEIVGGTFAEEMLFRPGDGAELAERMGRLLTLSGSELSAIGIQLREQVTKRFDPDRIAAKLLEAFR